MRAMFDEPTESSNDKPGASVGLPLCSRREAMDPAQSPEQVPYTDNRSMSGKIFVVVFLAIAVFLAGSITIMRLNVRPKYEAAVASSSAKAAALDAQRFAPTASAKPAEPAK